MVEYVCWVICTSSSSWLMKTVRKHASLVMTTQVYLKAELLHASQIAEKHSKPYNKTMHWIRLSSSLLRSVIMCCHSTIQLVRSHNEPHLLRGPGPNLNICLSHNILFPFLTHVVTFCIFLLGALHMRIVNKMCNYLFC